MTRSLLFLLWIIFAPLAVLSQECIFKDSLFTLNFGTVSNPQNFNLSNLSDYREVRGSCPNDGTFSFASSSYSCYDDHWFTLPTDHTNAGNGRMMIVNSAGRPATFFTVKLSGFKASTTYEFGLWMINICRINEECTDMLPSIAVALTAGNGQRIVELKSGPMQQTTSPLWKKYSGTFTTPADPGIVVLNMTTLSSGTCGNDFALDDITFRECYKPVPVEVPQPKPLPPAQKEIAAVVPTPVKPLPEQVLNKKNTAVQSLPTDKKTYPVTTGIRPVNIPEPLKTRENALVKKMLFSEGEISIELYDNGIVDGDTVSIFHNNVLVTSRAGLSEKPVKLKISLSPKEPHHEIIMVAENLGSIPPNTSLMILTAKGKREEVFISSNEQKNAKIVIDLKE